MVKSRSFILKDRFSRLGDTRSLVAFRSDRYLVVKYVIKNKSIQELTICDM